MQFCLPIVLSRLLRDRQRLGHRGQSLRRPTEFLVHLRHQRQEGRNQDLCSNLPVHRQPLQHLIQALLALPSFSEDPAALEDPDHRILANRLRLLVCAHLSDVDGYQDSLQRLGQWQSDTVLE